MEYVTIGTFDGKTMRGLWVPADTENASKAPGIVLIQEIFGINPAMQELAKIWSAKGFNVLCPVLFFPKRPNLQLAPNQPGEFQKGVKLLQGLNREPPFNDLASTANNLPTKK